MTDIDWTTIPREQWPFKLLVLHALTDTLKTITPANGYVVDLSDFDPGDGATMERVYRGRAWYGDTDPLPMVSVLEGVNQADDVYEPQVDTTTGEHDWQVLVQGFVADSPTHPTDPAYFLMRDVRKRLAKEKRRLKPNRQGIFDPLGASLFAPKGCGLVNITIGPGVVRPADDVSAKAYFWMSLTLRIVEDAEAP